MWNGLIRTRGKKSTWWIQISQVILSFALLERKLLWFLHSASKLKPCAPQFWELHKTFFYILLIKEKNPQTKHTHTCIHSTHTHIHIQHTHTHTLSLTLTHTHLHTQMGHLENSFPHTLLTSAFKGTHSKAHCWLALTRVLHSLLALSCSTNLPPSSQKIISKALFKVLSCWRT